jgi:hypothetical protein
MPALASGGVELLVVRLGRLGVVVGLGRLVVVVGLGLGCLRLGFD